MYLQEIWQKSQTKNLPKLFWTRNPRNFPSSVEKQQEFWFKTQWTPISVVFLIRLGKGQFSQDSFFPSFFKQTFGGKLPLFLFIIYH
jgi:hypothetical protein